MGIMKVICVFAFYISLIFPNENEKNSLFNFDIKNLKLLIIPLFIIILVLIIFLIYKKTHSNKSKKVSKNMIVNTIKITPAFDKLHLSFGNVQNIGRRAEQQDSFAISDINNKKLLKEKGVFAIVADGMGGLESGRESSSIVIDLMMHYFTQNQFVSDMPIELRNMLVNTNNELIGYLSKKGNIKSGSTLIAVIIKDYQLFWISVGDSRIYLYRKGKVYALNRDHIYSNQLYDKAINGEISFEEVLNDPDRKALTSYMGINEITEIDQNIRPFKLIAGDKIILCSDGIYGSLNETEIIEAMNLEPQNVAIQLEKSILNKNIEFQDNMTGIIIGVN